jgi:hypothetical protein
LILVYCAVAILDLILEIHSQCSRVQNAFYCEIIYCWFFLLLQYPTITLSVTAPNQLYTIHFTAAMVVAADSTDGNMDKKSLKGKINRESATR